MVKNNKKRRMKVNTLFEARIELQTVENCGHTTVSKKRFSCVKKGKYIS